MTRVCWPATPAERYEIDLVLGVSPLRLMVDTGLVDATGQVAFDLEAADYDAIDAVGHVLKGGWSVRYDASGRKSQMPVGFVRAHLFDPVTRTTIGPFVSVLAAKNVPGVPSRVGVAFFHALAGYRVDWDLSARLWCVECP